MATEDARKLFVAGLPESITEDVLRQLFEATGGKVVDVSLPRDRTTGRPRGFGFVTFASPEEAETARGQLDGSLQAGRPISVRPFSSEPPRRGDAPMGHGGPSGGGSGGGGGGGGGNEDRTLYVGNLPYDVTQQEVMQLFQDNEATGVVRVHLPAGPDGRLRGFGFVTLASAEAANAAIIALRSVEVRGRRLMINIAHPKGAPGAGGGGARPFSGGPSSGGGFGAPRFGEAPPDPAGDFNRGGERRAKTGQEETEDESQKKKKKKRGGGGGGGGGGAGGKEWGPTSWRGWDKDDDG